MQLTSSLVASQFGMLLLNGIEHPFLARTQCGMGVGQIDAAVLGAVVIVAAVIPTRCHIIDTSMIITFGALLLQ